MGAAKEVGWTPSDDADLEDVLGPAKREIANAEGRVSSARLLGDWLRDPELLRTRDIVIPHLAVEGRVSLLSGREKIGKSTLSAGAIAAASRARSVLGVPLTDRIRTLWYCLDEPIADTVRRFSALDANPAGIVINDKPRGLRQLLAALERDLDAFEDVGVVVLDTLSRVFAIDGVDPCNSVEAEPFMARLVDFFHVQNVAAVLLYHTGKGGKEYRGSTAIGATVDEVLTLRRRGAAEEDDFDDDTADDDGRRLLVQDGRNLRGRIHLSFRDGSYQPYQEIAVPRDRLLETLKDHGTVIGRAELTKLAGLRKQAGLKAIGELIGSGAIIENGRQLKLGSVGSLGFPQAGTAREPTGEPIAMSGSHFAKGGAAETGTVKQITRTVERDGARVVEVLRPTAHGERWMDA